MVKITLFKGGNMKYCSRCGSGVKEGAKFCEHCGKKLEEIKNNTKNNNQQYESANLHNSNIDNVKNQKSIIVVRYCIGGLFILEGLASLPNLVGFLSIFLGLSLMPIVYKILKEKRIFDFKGMQIIFPVVLIILFGLANSISNNDYSIKENNDINENSQNSESVDNKSDNNKTSNVEQSLEEKWKNYYKDNNIEVVEVDNETLHNYGKYYKEKTILTGIEIGEKTTKSIKAKIGDSESIYYSFVFNFEDKSEIKKYNKGDKVIIVGEVSTTTNDKTVTLNKCHIILSSSQAQVKIEELSNNKTKYTEYVKSIKEEQDRKGDIGKAYIEILDSKIINSYNQNVLVVSLLYKNNSNDNKSFNYTANVSVFQKGIELQSSIMKCSWYNSNYEDNGDVEIKPGITVTVNKCFLISDVTSDVEVNVESWMFSNLYNKLNKTFKLG